MGLKLSRTGSRGVRRSVALTSVFSLLFLQGFFLLGLPAAAQPFSGGLAPTIFGSRADLNGDGVVNGKDDSNAFYGDTAIIDGKLDCNAWDPLGTNGNSADDMNDGPTEREGPKGDLVITGADDCTMIGVDGTPDGVEIDVVNGFFIARDGVAIPDGTQLPFVFNDSDPDNPSVLASDFAWSTINGRVDASGDEVINEKDCSLGLIGQTEDVGLGDPLDGINILATDATGTDPCTGLKGPAAADDGLVDLNSDENITFTGSDNCDGCFLGHNVKEGVVQEEGAPPASPPTSNPFSGGFSPTIFGFRADLNGSGTVSGRDDSGAFYGNTAIIDGMLDCNAWTTANHGLAGDGAITTADDCTLIGYDGTADGVEITVVNGEFRLADGALIADGTRLPTVFPQTGTPNDPDIGNSKFAWSTINGRVDANGDEAIDSGDCSLGLIGQTNDSGLGDPHDGADVVSSDATATDPCTGLIGPAAADDGLVDLNSDRNITFDGDSCTNGCFFGHDVLEGVVQQVPSISINDVTVSEGAGTATFTVSLSVSTQSTVTVNFATANGTATAGSDYTATSGTLTFAAGDTSETVSVPILEDTTDEPDETFFVNLSNATNATIADAQGQGTIQDNDPQPSISINDVTVGEGDGTATFTVTLSNPSSSTVTVNFATANGTATAGSDYTAASGTLTFVAGDTSETVSVPILEDALDEANETFLVNLSTPTNATCTGGDCQGQGTITDNDPGPTISINDVTVGEGDGTAIFTVTLSAASAQTVTVQYATTNGTATAGSDYTAASGTLTFVPGDTSETVSVPILEDALDEANETFFVNLSNPTNATIADGQGVGTITDNDPAPSISINDVTVGEGDGTAIFTVTLSAASGQTVTVNFATANGTATAGSDYTATSGTLTFAPGDTSETVSVPILDDTVDEPNETFFVNLSTPTNATIADAQGQGTITDNDPTPPGCPALADGWMAYHPAFTGGVYVAAGDLDGDGCDEIVTGAGAGGGPHVRIFAANGTEIGGFFAYGPGFTGGVRVAVGDVNGDEKADIITGAGPGGGPHVRVFSGADTSVLHSFMAYDPSFTGGVYVGAGNLTGDAKAEIVTGAGEGGGPHVRIFSGTDLSELGGFMAYSPAFTGGVRVAGANADGGAFDEVITGPGPGGGPHVRVLKLDGSEVLGFMAYNPAFTGGVFVGGGQEVAGGTEEIVTGAGQGGGPHVVVRSGSGAIIREFMAYNPAFTGGVRVAVSNGDGDTDGEVLTGPGPGGGPHVRLFE